MEKMDFRGVACMKQNLVFKITLFLLAVLFIKVKILYYLPFYRQFEVVLYQPNYMIMVQLAGIAVLYYLTAATYKPKTSQWIRFVVSGLVGSWIWCLVAFGIGEFQVWINSHTLPMWMYSWSSTIHILIAAICPAGILFLASASIAQWPWPKRSEQKRKQIRLIWLAFFAASVVMIRLYQLTYRMGSPILDWQGGCYIVAILFLPLVMVALAAYTLSPEQSEQMEHADKQTE